MNKNKKLIREVHRKKSVILDFNNSKPLFSFQYLKNPYCISDCTKDEKASLADKLRILSNLTWAQLKSSHRHSNGYEKINGLEDKLPIELRNKDITIIAFRFFGKAPMVGYREENIFHIIWLDRNFSLYKHS